MANVKLGSKAVGSIVKLKVNGTAEEFIVVHQGKPGSMYDDSCNGTWLLMKDIYENRKWHSSNVNKYETSDINTYLNSTFLGLFDSNIRDAIKQVKIPYRKNGGSGGTDQSGANGLLCKIFLLSGYEVGFTTSNNRYFPIDGAKLSYFESGNGTSANNKRIAKLNGSSTYWWFRSPYTGTTLSVYRVYPHGDLGYNDAASSIGIRPALVLPSGALVDDSGNVLPPVDLTAHKTLINGTDYIVEGGKCMVNGTVYNILKGRTLIGGTGYDIKFSEQQTWVINELSAARDGETYEIKFSSNGKQFSRIVFEEPGRFSQYLYYDDLAVANAAGSGYYHFVVDQAYRTITFDEPPTGDLLTWLQANAVQQ